MNTRLAGLMLVCLLSASCAANHQQLVARTIGAAADANNIAVGSVISANEEGLLSDEDTEVALNFAEGVTQSLISINDLAEQPGNDGAILAQLDALISRIQAERARLAATDQTVSNFLRSGLTAVEAALVAIRTIMGGA